MSVLKLDTIDKLNAVTEKLKNVHYLLDLISDKEELDLIYNSTEPFKASVSARYFLLIILENLIEEYRCVTKEA